MRSFIIYDPHQILLGRTNHEKCDGWAMFPLLVEIDVQA
jgi:hypothetical protein